MRSARLSYKALKFKKSALKDLNFQPSVCRTDALPIAPRAAKKLADGVGLEPTLNRINSAAHYQSATRQNNRRKAQESNPHETNARQFSRLLPHRFGLPSVKKNASGRTRTFMLESGDFTDRCHTNLASDARKRLRRDSNTRLQVSETCVLIPTELRSHKNNLKKLAETPRLERRILDLESQGLPVSLRFCILIGDQIVKEPTKKSVSLQFRVMESARTALKIAGE